MRKFKFSTLLVVMITFYNCSKDHTPEEVAPQISYDTTFYMLTDKSAYDYNDFLQSTTVSGNIQFSTFGEIGDDGLPGNFTKTYVYDNQENTEAIILYDDSMEPAFIYNVDLATGQKMESVSEFEKIDDNNFYYRIYHYDWTNRLGTLLFETIISKTSDSYESAPTFEIENTSFLDKSSVTKSKKKSNNSFNRPILRLERLKSKNTFAQKAISNNRLLEGFMDSFDNLRNSDIGNYLVKAQKLGLGLGFLGVSGLIATPVAATVITAGGALFLGGLAIETMVTDKWKDRLSNLQSSLSNLTENTLNFEGDVVNIVSDYKGDLTGWLNDNIPNIDIEDLLNSIDSDEIISSNDNLNDLPDTSGVLQIGLSWSTNNTDIDLWVTDPSGTKIYYDNPSSTTGGFLDRDDVDGYGPENIYWSENIPQGSYTVQVHYYGCDVSDCVSTNYELVVSNGLGYRSTYSGTLSDVNEVNNVVTFTVDGGVIQ